MTLTFHLHSPPSQGLARSIQPALAIFGVTVAGDFYSALKIEDVSGGFLNRFLILQEKSRPKEKEPESWVGHVPWALMEKLLQVSRKYQSSLGKDVMDRKAEDINRNYPCSISMPIM